VGRWAEQKTVKMRQNEVERFQVANPWKQPRTDVQSNKNNKPPKRNALISIFYLQIVYACNDF